MPSKSTIATTILTLLTALSATAAITGRVVDKTTQTPLEFVNVVALSADSAFITGCTTDSIGRFSLTATNTPATVSFSVIGYERCAMPVPASGEFGNVAMTPSAVSLAEVTVENHTPATRLQGNSFITTVAGTFMSTLVSAADVMQWIPGVTVIGNEIKAFQKNNPLIYINSRKITSFQDIEALEASNIASIEVIPSPGVKYGIGTDCVIIIHTKRNLADSFSASIISANTLAHHYSNSEHINLAFRQNGFEITAKGSFSHHDAFFANETSRESFGAKPWVNESSQTVRHKQNDGSAEIGISYDFSPTQSVGATYRFEGNRFTETGTVSQQMIFADGDKTLNMTNGNSRHKILPDHYANIYYNGTMGKLTLDFNGDILSSDHNAHSLKTEQSSIRPDYYVNTTSQSSTFMAAEQLIATLSLDKFRLMVGEEFTHTRMESEFANPEQIVADNSSRSQENNIALFADLSASFGNMSASVGARYEHTDATYRFTRTETETTRRHLNNWFPSAGVNGTFGNTRLSISYSYYSLRPNYRQLDASINYIDPYLLKQGNPLLEDSRLHNLSLYAQWKRLWGNFYFRNQSNPILHCSVPYDADSPVMINTFRNFNSRQAFGANIGGNFTLGHWYCSGSIAYVRQWFSMPYKNGHINLDSNDFGLYLNNRLTLPWGLNLSVNYYMNSAYNYFNTHYRPAFSLDASLSKSLLKDALYAEISATDILQKVSAPTISYDNLLLTHQITLGDRRRFRLTLRYTFNASRNRYKGTGAGQSEKNRL